nr:hypothetical protein [Tanacetum cinerariifolium]
MEEIDLSINLDDLVPPGIEEDDDDSERDILIHEELLDNYSLSLPVNESFYFDIPSFSRPPAKPPDGNTRILNIKMMGDNSEQKVPKPNLTITRVSNQEKSPDLLSHRSLEIFKLSSTCPMMIHGKNIPILDILACCDDDDGYNSAITPNEPVDSLSMGDEHLNTILAMESDKFIKSSVENLVPNQSESEGENGCDVYACFTTFSNILFNDDYEFDSSDDQSLYDEDIPEKIFSNPLFEEEIIPMKIDQHHDNAESTHNSSLIISSKIDSLLYEFVGELTLLKSILPGIDETDCDPEEDIRIIERLLYDNSSPRPPKELVSENSDAEIESFSPSPIPIEDIDSFMEEIDLSFTPDDPIPPGIAEDDYNTERDIIREELLDNYSLSLPVNESFHFDIPSFFRPPAKPPDGNTGILNIKMMGDISDQKVPMHKLMITRVSNKEKSPDLLSHRSLEIFQPSVECPMMIHGKNIPILDVPLFHFYPLD